MAIFQNGNDVFGAGKIKEGNNTIDVTVSGAVADATLDLNVVSMNPISLYKLKLDLSGELGLGRVPGIFHQRRLLDRKRRGREDGLNEIQIKCRETGI